MISPRRNVALLVGCLLLAAAAPAPTESGKASRTLRVGPTQEFRVPSAAAAVARDGDVVEIDAGTYSGDVAVWRANRLTLRGVGAGYAHLRADGNDAEGKAIWVIKGDRVKVENIEFSGARVRDGNGAGIRQEGTDLTVRNCYFHENQMGLLAGDNPRSKIIIEYSVFENSDSDTALGHNIYVNTVKRFILRYSYSHGATHGHDVKSRAKRTDLLYNRLADESDGRSSYVVDLPNAGKATLIGNVIQQGPRAENRTVVSYGEEGYVHRANQLYLSHNTVVNDAAPGTFVRVAGDPSTVRLVNNLFVGPGSLGDDPSWSMDGNLVRSSDPGFTDAGSGDYMLRAGSVAIDAGVQVTPARLLPRFEYVPIAGRIRRVISGKPDVGAYER